MKPVAIRRPGTAWVCDIENKCDDSIKGLRGDDVIWTPQGATCRTPRVIFLHGGSWYYGSPASDGYDVFASRLAAQAGAIVFVIDYRLAPVGNFTDTMRSSMDGFRWLLEHGPSGQDCASDEVAPMFIAGDSAGGGSALSLVLNLLHNEPTLARRLSGTFVYSPWTNLKCNSPTYYTNSYSEVSTGASGLSYVGDIIFKSNAIGNEKEFRSVALEYVSGSVDMLASPLASPLRADSSSWLGAPPLHVTVSDNEVSSSDGIILAQKVALAGVAVALDIYPGMWHDFQMYSEGCGGGNQLWQGVRAMERTATFIRHVSASVEGGVGRLSWLGPAGSPSSFLHTTFHYDAPLGGEHWIPHTTLPSLLAVRREENAPVLCQPHGQVMFWSALVLQGLTVALCLLGPERCRSWMLDKLHCVPRAGERAPSEMKEQSEIKSSRVVNSLACNRKDYGALPR